MQEVEKAAELLPEDRDLRRDFRLMQRMARKVGEVVEGDGVIALRGNLAGEPAQIGFDTGPAAFVRTGEVREGYFRPIDTRFFIAPEKRADRVDEEKLHEDGVWITAGRFPRHPNCLPDGNVTL